MSIVQTFIISVRENGIIRNGKQTHVWRDQIRQRGPFGTAVFNGSTWSFKDLAGYEVDHGLDDCAAARMCAWGMS